MPSSAFAAHLNKLGLFDGKGGEATASVARNTWHRVKAAHNTGNLGGRDVAPSAGEPGPASANQNDDGAQQASCSSSPTTETPSQDEDAAQDARAPSGDDYPPGIRALAATDSTGDSAPATPDLPKSGSSAAPDHAPPPSLSEGEHRTNESTSWTATFTAKPPADIIDLLKQNGGEYDGKRACWNGASANDLLSLTSAVKGVDGSLQVSPSAQPKT